MLIILLFVAIAIWVTYKIVKFLLGILTMEFSWSGLTNKFSTVIEVVKETKSIALSKYGLIITFLVIGKVIYEHVALIFMEGNLLELFRDQVYANIRGESGDFYVNFAKKFSASLPLIFLIYGFLMYYIDQVCLKQTKIILSFKIKDIFNKEKIKDIKNRIKGVYNIFVGAVSYLVLGLFCIELGVMVVFSTIFILVALPGSVCVVLNYFGDASPRVLVDHFIGYYPGCAIIYVSINKILNASVSFVLDGSMKNSTFVYYLIIYTKNFLTLRFTTRIISYIANFAKVSYFDNFFKNNVPVKVLFKGALIFTVIGIIGNKISYDLNRIFLPNFTVLNKDKFSALLADEFGVVANLSSKTATYFPLVSDLFQVFFITIPMVITCVALYKNISNFERYPVLPSVAK